MSVLSINDFPEINNQVVKTVLIINRTKDEKVKKC